MRSIKKRIRNWRTRYRYRESIAETKRQIASALGGDISFAFSSFGGADIHYTVLRKGKRIGIARIALLNHADTALPIVRFNKQKRLQKELEAYRLGSKEGLTPHVLYGNEQTVVCEYLSGVRVYEDLKKDKKRVWRILEEAVRHYARLHALGVTHLDATLKNFIRTETGLRIIDFEYYPAENFSPDSQKAYDYVRIIEHTLRMIPSRYQSSYEPLIEVLEEIVPDEVKRADLRQVSPLLENIRNFPIYKSLKDRVFDRLVFEEKR